MIITAFVAPHTGGVRVHICKCPSSQDSMVYSSPYTRNRPFLISSPNLNLFSRRFLNRSVFWLKFVVNLLYNLVYGCIFLVNWLYKMLCFNYNMSKINCNTDHCLRLLWKENFTTLHVFLFSKSPFFVSPFVHLASDKLFCHLVSLPLSILELLTLPWSLKLSLIYLI